MTSLTILVTTCHTSIVTMPRKRAVMTDNERAELPSSLFILSGTNCFRRAAVWLVRWIVFEWIIILTIIGKQKFIQILFVYNILFYSSDHLEFRVSDTYFSISWWRYILYTTYYIPAYSTRLKDWWYVQNFQYRRRLSCCKTILLLCLWSSWWSWRYIPPISSLLLRGIFF